MRSESQQLAPSLRVHRGEFLFAIDNFADLGEEPPINFGEAKDFVDAEAGAESVPDEKDAFGIGHAQFLADQVAGKNVAITIDFFAEAPGPAIAAESVTANFEGAQGFLERFLKRASNRHGFADAFHLGVKRGIGLWKFFEGKT